MIEYIDGELVERTPTFGVIETGGIGYIFQTTLNTFESLNGKKRVKIYMHTSIREDAHVLFGFSHDTERTMFRSLISVSGIGPASAIAALSTYSPVELRDAIVNADVPALRRIKGVGADSSVNLLADHNGKKGSGQHHPPGCRGRKHHPDKEPYDCRIKVGNGDCTFGNKIKCKFPEHGR